MECLLEQEVDTVFGYPGGTILNLYDELYHYQDKIHHVLTAHEQGAAHAADGYARSTGKVGVCFATSGPGATNLTTGIATAYMDSSPVVFITCNVSEGLLGKDSFQEVDITGIAMPITKATYLVRDPQTIPDVMRQAFAVAATGRPGPVLIDFLKNVTFLNTMIDYEFIPWDQNRGTNSIRQLAVSHGLKAPEPDLGDIDTLVDMIAQSERPLLICGGIVFEYFSYGFGFVGLTLFIMQQVAPGPHKMAHYAFGSSLANLGVMLPGMASGWLCDQVGYHRFFLWALMATIPIFLIAWRIPFAHPDTEEGAAQAVEKELTDE